MKKAAGIFATAAGCALIVGIQIGVFPATASFISLIAIPGGLFYSAYVDLKPLMNRKRGSGRWS